LAAEINAASLMPREARMRDSLPSAFSLLLCVGLAIALSAEISLARAQASSSNASASSSAPTASAFSSSKHRGASRHIRAHAPEHRQAWSVDDEPYIGLGAPQWRYFVEFRARNADSYGHMYVMFGEVNDRHEITKSEVAGFFPAGDDRDCVNCSVYYWMIGHVLPVPSEIGASDGDLEEQYVLARFRVWVDAQQYQSLVAYINERKAHKALWNAFFANCVTFVRDVASFLDVKMPPLVAFSPTVLMYPKYVVVAMREANGLKSEQQPLRDAAGELPVETDVQHATTAAQTAKTLPSPSKKRIATGRVVGQPVSGMR
jgi:hypothetical protein